MSSDEFMEVSSAVSQGSVLAPYLPSVTWDLSHHLLQKHSWINLQVTSPCFAMMYLRIKIVDSVKTIRNNEQQSMKSWRANNRLPLNNDTTKVLIFKKTRIDYTALNVHALIWTSLECSSNNTSRRLHILTEWQHPQSVASMYSDN